MKISNMLIISFKLVQGKYNYLHSINATQTFFLALAGILFPPEFKYLKDMLQVNKWPVALQNTILLTLFLFLEVSLDPIAILKK